MYQMKIIRYFRIHKFKYKFWNLKKQRIKKLVNKDREIVVFQIVVIAKELV